MKKFTALFAAMAVVLAASGCSSENPMFDADNILGEFTDVAPGMGTGGDGGAGTGGVTGFGSDAAADGLLSGSMGAAAEAYDYGMAPSAPAVKSPENGGSENTVRPQAGLLTGGEWNDNSHWSDWLALYQNREDWSGYKTGWRIGWDERVCVKVTAGGQPLEGAKVSCSTAKFSSVTDNKGMAYLFFSSVEDVERTITVEYNGETKTIDQIQIAQGGEAFVEFDSAAVSEKSLDLMIVCDTTGSMSDELEYLKTELSEIILRIKNENSNLPTRVSVNFYRDEGDEYVVRPFDFTTDINEAVSQINAQSANGGGDFPEAVHTALDNAVNGHAWNESSVKIMFLVLDAPAHNDAQIIDSLNSYVAKAAEMGIRIIPVASSGIDKSTEYLLRTIAIETNGTSTVLTNDSGIGGDHLEPTVGAFNVEKLGDMMVRIVGEYLK